ncbi:unnamed protein product, partial [Ectocarpus sp. 4 AP-2014]
PAHATAPSAAAGIEKHDILQQEHGPGEHHESRKPCRYSRLRRVGRAVAAPQTHLKHVLEGALVCGTSRRRKGRARQVAYTPVCEYESESRQNPTREQLPCLVVDKIVASQPDDGIVRSMVAATEAKSSSSAQQCVCLPLSY